MAMDRDFIADRLSLGVLTAANSFVPPGTANYPWVIKPFWAGWPIERRQAEARRLLAAAGYGPGHPLRVEIKIRGTTESGFFSQAFPAIQNDWKSVGVAAVAVREEGQIAYADFRAGNFQIADATWGADYDDAMSFLDQWKSDTGPMNYPDYRNPAYDALLAKADAERDLKKRAVFMSEAERMMLEDAPIAPIFYYITDNLVNPNVTGWVENVMNFHPSRYLCFAK
jgi:oligopeptide transport system substrate-binding protein